MQNIGILKSVQITISGEVLLISKEVPDVAVHDVEMISEIVKTIGPGVKTDDLSIVSVLTKAAALRADDAMTLKEAEELAKMVNELGPGKYQLIAY